MVALFGFYLFNMVCKENHKRVCKNVCAFAV